MKQVYQAADGTIFNTEAECNAYENKNKLHFLIANSITKTQIGPGFRAIEVNDVKIFIEQHIDEIIRIVKGEITVTPDDGWISNEGNDAANFPDGILGGTHIDVKYRYGATRRGYANDWDLSWRSSDNDPLDIIAYRIVT